jgi:hypothetical protein
MATVLQDYEIRFYHPDVATYLSAVDHTNPHATQPMMNTMDFSTARIGGSQDASITLIGNDADYLSGVDAGSDWDHLEAGAICLIRMQCTGDGSMKSRYIGMVMNVEMGEGSNPKERVVECIGLWRLIRQYPLLAIIQSKTIKAALTAVYAELTKSRLATGRLDLITYDPDPTFTVDTYDFINTWGNVALDALAVLAGPDAAWGIVPSTSAVEQERGYGQLYFAQTGTTPVDYGFEVGSSRTVGEVVRRTNAESLINGALIMGQRKLAGGDLILWKSPPEDDEIWRIAKITTPEAVHPENMWRCGTKTVEGLSAIVDQIEFRALNFGRQAYANEVINNPLAIILTEGGSAHSVWPDTINVTVSEDGSVDTVFKLGSRPFSSLASTYPAIYRDIIVNESNLFWSASELAARDNDIIRDWRRHAALNHAIMNFWGTNLDNIESIMSYDAWADGGYDEPTGFPNYGWAYDSEQQRVTGSDAQGTIASIAIPTGLTAGAAIAYIKTGGASYNQKDTEHWVQDMAVSPNVGGWMWMSDWFGIRPNLSILPTNAWRAGVTCAYQFLTGAPELPMKVWVGPLEQFFDTTTPTTYGAMKTLSHYIDIVFASSSTDPTTADGYCLRLHRTSGDTAGDVSCALGWVSAGVFHSNWWDAGAEPDATGVGTIGLGNDASGVTDTHSFEIDVWLPTSAGSGEFRVRVRKNRTAEILWDSAAIHGDGEVSGSAPTPVGRYYTTFIYYEATPKSTDHYTCGLKNIDIESPGGVGVAVSRDGEFWTIGEANTLLPLFGDTYLEGERQIMFAVELGEGNSLASWAVGFLHETPEASLAWDQNFGDTGSGNGEFFTPRDCTVDSDYIYIVESGNHRVQILTNTDPPVYLAKFGAEGSADGEFDNPSGIAQDDTYLYVADTVNARISMFLKASPYTFIRHIGVGTLSSVNGLTVEGGTYSADGLVYALNGPNDTVYIFKKDGTSVDSFTPFTDLPSAEIAMSGITISDDEDHLYIANSGNNTPGSLSNCVRKFKRTSPYTQIWTWGARGQNPPTGLLEYPYSVCQLGDLLFVGSGSNAVTPARNFITTLADRGSDAEYLDHIDGTGGESGKGMLQPAGCDIKNNIVYVCEVGYDQIKRFIVS